jgi:pimeloyl-ACP methyl ester carboxylesterase
VLFRPRQSSVNLLSLGTAQRRIFAIHEAAAPSPNMRAAVLCQPLGTEYIYAHRSMRQLALRLAMSGVHTLRFDYYGTGDSAGDESEVEPAACQVDVESAMEGLADIAGTPRVTLIGLRAGANIAARVAARRATDVETLVLWDPLVSDELQGLAAELPQRTAIFVTDSAQARDRMSRTDLGSGKRPALIEFVPAPCPWLESATITGILPMPVIQRIVKWLC